MLFIERQEWGDVVGTYSANEHAGGIAIGPAAHGATPQPEAFAVTQRRRMLHTNLLAACVTLAVCFAEVAAQGVYDARWHLLAALHFFVGYGLISSLVSRGIRVQLVNRIWMALGCLGLWADLTISGGVNGHAAPMLFLLPVGAALILQLRDTVIVGIANALAMGLVAWLEVSGLVQGVPSERSPLTAAIVLAVASLSLTATVTILVKHNLRIQNTLRAAFAHSQYMAEHDQLTGLKNRQWANARLATIVDHQLAHNLMLIDLDGFKQVNDVHGHHAGDQLLRAVAERLTQQVHPAETVIRLGGDEFMILSPCNEMGKCRADLANRVIRAVSTPFDLNGREAKISCSIGIARYPDDASSGTALMERADLALYTAKSSGKAQVKRFDPELEERHRYEKTVLARLKLALPEDELKLHYQPQYALKTGRLIGFEALARWTDAELGNVPPDVFIHVAEKYGLIGELGEYLLRRACLEARSWLNWGAPNDDLRLSVNISAAQLDRAALVKTVQSVLAETDFPADRLELEITETVLIRDTDKAVAQLNALAALGIGVALDDFGTGYASLSYLNKLNLNRLKIDRSFIARLDQPRGKAFVRAIVQLADALELTVVAEGVETEDQREVLKEMECAAVQGFLYSPSAAPEHLMAILLGQTDQSAETPSEMARRPSVG